MAGYRPKSLEELNNMFGKTMAAEKAIKKGTSLLEKNEAETADISGGISGIVSAENTAPQPVELTGAVNDFIAKYSETPVSKKISYGIPEEKAKPRMTVLVPETPEVQVNQTENADFSAQNTQQYSEQREQPVRRADRNELMEEYMRIMSDEDDDIPEKKLSRKEKKKKKKKDKYAAAEQDAENTAEDTQEQFVQQENQEIYSQNDEVAADFFTESTEAEEKDDFDFPEDYTPEWIENDLEADGVSDGQDILISEGADQQSYYEDAVDEPMQPVSVKGKKNGGKVFLKAFLCVMLVLIVLAGGCATMLKTVLSINTGKSFNDSYYIFTAYKSYEELSLNEGDLVITEKVYAEDGDIFAYIDYSEKTFEFGKRLDGITNDDGEVLIVTEKNASRTLVSRDDCKGVVKNVYPSIGRYVSFVTDDFIVVISALAVAALVIVLVLINGFKSKKNDGDRDGEVSANEEYENLFSTIE